MNRNIQIGMVGAFAALVLLLTGCPSGQGGGPIAPVSGTITKDGQPVAGVTVEFSPVPEGESPNTGPWSAATTDGSGKYSLKTRYDEPGAVVGTHQVHVYYEGLEELIANVESLNSGGPDGVDAAALAAAEADLKKKQDSIVEIPAKFRSQDGSSEVTFEVPKGGTSSADFDLSDGAPPTE